MSDSDRGTHLVELYTPYLRWRGEIQLASMRRLSDFVNDNATTFLLLERAALATLNKGALHEMTQLDQVAINKSNIHALLLRADPQHSLRREADWKTARITRRVMVFAPPFALSGDIHVARSVEWLNALNVLHSNFISLTDVTLYRLDAREPLAQGVPFAMVSRTHTVAIQSLVSAEPVEVSQFQSLQQMPGEAIPMAA